MSLRAQARKTKSATMNVFGRKHPLPAWLGRAKKQHPLVVVCLDGHDPAYMQRLGAPASIYNGKRTDKKYSPAAPNKLLRMPEVSTLSSTEAFNHLVGDCAMPSFTNPNNVSIITGQPPSVHGICGNYFYDTTTKDCVSMNDPKFFYPHPTKSFVSFLAAFEAHQYHVGCITSKNKLLRMLKGGLNADQEELNSRFFSIESIGGDIYSPDASLDVFRKAVALQQNPTTRFDVMYLTTTDYMQHKYFPGEQPMLEFYQELDALIGTLRNECGCIVGVTADHGMSAKPNIFFLGDELLANKAVQAICSTKEALMEAAKIILPITDPYVAHHAALGSCAYIKVIEEDTNAKAILVDAIAAALRKSKKFGGRSLDVLSGVDAQRKHGIPMERSGDLVIVGSETTAIGTYRADHDLSALATQSTLRSHGGCGEQAVPLMLDQRLSIHPSHIPSAKGIHNYDIFPMMLRGRLSSKH